MASVKVKFRPSSVDGQEGNIYYQILHERKPRQLSTDYKIFPFEWEEKRGQVVTQNDSIRKSLILSIQECIRWDVERLFKISRRLEIKGLNYTADDIIDEFWNYKYEYSLFN